ncbi:MAG: hypothetical protein MUE96_10140 [Bacteroidia bacterium]|jgi:hypothetical protein|nr:hypothetical protein [Bacteroidia bacterium]
MNQFKFIWALLVVGSFTLIGCEPKNSNTTSTQQTVADSADASCSQETVMDPNNAKPMALMMRQMAANADSMKAAILRYEQLDSTKYPFIRFYLVEPTDPSVLEPTFYENARLFQEAYQALFKHPKEQAKHFNLVIQKCVNCHESYCSGPLKRIRKLYIPLTQNP